MSAREAVVFSVSTKKKAGLRLHLAAYGGGNSPRNAGFLEISQCSDNGGAKCPAMEIDKGNHTREVL
jgi:hypothetical protein